jgi:dipeptide transport system ATP-binding protein
MSAAATLSATAAGDEAILRVANVSRFYRINLGGLRGAATLMAVNDVSFTLTAGKTLAVVGESGCGKSTLARLVAMIEPPSAGRIIIDGIDVAGAPRAALKRLRSEVQIVFQDPYGSLNPRQKIGSMLEEPLKINRREMPGAARRAAAFAMMERVGLRREHYDRYPHMFSGGQRQRIAIARALMLRPRIVILDEPVSALDLSVRAQVLNILSGLKDEFGLAYLFISHDLSVVRQMADEVMVMYLGRAVEIGSRDELFTRPRHPYTRALLAATPVADPLRPRERLRLKGELPSPINPPMGCAFNPRCPLAFDRCRVERPELKRKGGVDVACFAVDPDGAINPLR